MGAGMYLVLGLIAFNFGLCVAAILLRIYFKLSFFGPDNFDKYIRDNMRIQ